MYFSGGPKVDPKALMTGQKVPIRNRTLNALEESIACRRLSGGLSADTGHRRNPTAAQD
jgi:hypothetical protein